MNSSTQAAQLLWQHRQSGLSMAHFPPALRPADRVQGYAVQAELARISAQPVVGWKIAATSLAGQQHIGVSGPMAGRLFAPTLVPEGQAMSLRGVRMLVAEPEMCFVLGQDLPAREQAYTQAEVMAAVSALHVAFELPNSRFEDFVTAGEASLIADNACGHSFMLGQAAPDVWRQLDLSQHPVHATITQANAAVWTREGSGAAVLGDPRAAMTWMANEMKLLGTGLKQGECVTTGVCMTPIAINVGDHILADFGLLGRIEVSFVA